MQSNSPVVTGVHAPSDSVHGLQSGAALLRSCQPATGQRPAAPLASGETAGGASLRSLPYVRKQQQTALPVLPQGRASDPPMLSKSVGTTEQRMKAPWGGVGAPPPDFFLRSRRETNTQDTTNARMYATMDIGFRPPLRAVMDEAPIASRGVTQAPYAAAPDFFGQGGAPASLLGNNAFFDRMDITQDPRNVAREVRSGVTEDNVDADVYMNNRMMSRESQTRYIPPSGVAGAEPSVDHTLRAYDQLRAQNSSFVVMPRRV